VPIEQWEHVMSQAETNSGTIQQRKSAGRSLSSAKETALLVFGSAFLITTLWIAAFLIIFTGIAFAQGRVEGSAAPRVAALPGSGAAEVAAPPAFDLAALPLLDSIDAQTDITVFLRSDVPAELQLAALRRAWTVDPAIRDFRGLQENDWNFERPNSIAGFGELGPEVDVAQMVARILGEPARVALADSTSPLRRRP
jgi:hypothetical protein